MTHPFSRSTREALACPYCSERHPEDHESCPTTGQVILLDGKYRLKQVLGEGSFGVVWDARNIDTQKEVAIKSLRVEVVRDVSVLGRFFWEATAAGRIHNPHVCDVLDLVKSGAHGPYIVLERLSGRSLEALILEQGRLEPETAVRLLRQALIGLGAVHRAGIVHRDVKPENIFLHEPEPGVLHVKLLDFGISKFSAGEGSKSRTAADLFMGTPEYTSPEQARGAAEVDPRTDIWAIGAILYRALAGVQAFDGPDVPSILTAILHTPHTPLGQVAPHVPAGLAAVVDRCLSKPRELRHGSCDELSAALEPFEGPAPARARVDAEPPERDDSLAFSLASDERVQVGDLVEVPRPESSLEIELSEPPAAAVGGEQVLLSCNSADRHWLDHLRRHLGGHGDGGQFKTRDLAEFEGGLDRREALAAAFAAAKAVVLLVSAQYLEHDFAPGLELYAFVLMAQERDLPVMWIAVSESDHEGSDLREFKALGDPTRPLDRLSFAEIDRTFEEICDQLVVALGGPFTPVSGARTPERSKPDSAQHLQQRLDLARARMARLEALGEDARSVREEINMLRRSLRMGRPLQRGDVLDERFVVLDQLGAGGFATVWQALDQSTGAAVALKVLHAQHVHNPERRERFFRGARIMAQLDHANIVKIIEPWASDGEYEYFVMQYVSGGTLRDAVLSGRLSTGKRVELLLTVAEALAFAHERGIIHRDVKPSNILVADDDTPYLTDFDLVRAEDTTGGTAGGLGTVIYAAPEMMERASEADARADVYGLGMTLAFLYHERDLTMEVIRNTDRLIGELKVPEAIRMVIRTAITWNREHRFRTAAEFGSALSASLTRRESMPSMARAAVLEAAHSGTMLARVGPAPLASTVRAPAAGPKPRPSAGLPLGQVPRRADGRADTVTAALAEGLASAEATPGEQPAPAAEPKVSLVKAFAAIARESEARSDSAISEVFAALEVLDESGPRQPTVPLPIHDQTLPDTAQRLPPVVIAMLALAAGVTLTLAYLLLTN